MEEHFEILNTLRQPTRSLESKFFKVLLSKSHNPNLNRQVDDSFWNNIVQSLWDHLNVGLSKFEDQLLCSTCFYNLLQFHKDKSLLLNKILNYIDRHYEEQYNQVLPESTSTEVTLSLIHGLLQSSFLMNSEHEKVAVIKILSSSLNILVLMAYEYSNYTYIVFKIINSFQKLENSEYILEILNEKTQNTLLDLVNHNWENPVNGVRDLNKSIFGFLWNHLNSDNISKIFKTIMEFTWNKAKYLMLTEIILKYPGSILNLFDKNKDLIKGLIDSLYCTGLVSAGTDMYNATLSKINSENEWCILLLHHINNMLSGKSLRAIDNFSNYWCLDTLRKFPVLFQKLLSGLQPIECFETNYSITCLMRQANRLGILNTVFGDMSSSTILEEFLVKTLISCNTNSRLLAFEILCTLHSRYMPSEWECTHVIQFLEDNINTDATVLRISMLNSLKQFLNKIHIAFLNSTKNFDGTYIDPILLTFCSNIQTIVNTSLDFENANYQRKITTIKICDSIWTSFTNAKRQKQCVNEKGLKTSLLQELDNAGVWTFRDEKFVQKLFKMLQDPANDIRENVVNIILNHYSCMFEKNEMFHELVETGFTCLSSKFFYEISCGHSILSLISNMFVKYKCRNLKYHNIEALFLYVFETLIEEYHCHKSVVQSVENGIQLHALVNTLMIIIEICIKNSYPIEFFLNKSQLTQLSEVIDEISTQFIYKEDETGSLDFSEMSLMVEDMILKSNFNVNRTDETKISGLHQIILNCIWLNVKASCDLCAMLIRSFNDDCYLEYSQKCLNIIIKVLETSRHKGAIEAAGSALGIAIEYLTLLPDETNLSKMTFNLLKGKLNEMLQKTSTMASVTRRGAGLSIMVHKIVSSDKRKGKPTFHYFLKILLKKFQSVQLQQEMEFHDKANIQRDLPEAIHIHFLTRIVTDSSLHPDIMHYADSLGQLAFKSLTSEHWQIRNAALQLYGALVPKFLGQKKSCGNSEENVATVACDEFRTHFPKLWCYIHEQLRSSSCDIQAHSNLVPILNLLAHMAKKYSFDIDVHVNMKYVCDDEFLEILLNLLGSPIYTVRCLTSKTIYLNYSLDVVVGKLDFKNIYVAENLLHGYLSLTEIYHKDMKNCRMEQCYILLKKYYERLMVVKKRSYLCRKLYDEMFLNVNQLDLITEMKNVIEQLKNDIHAPGISVWANVHIKKYVYMSPWTTIPEILNVIMHEKEHIIYCEFLLERVQSETNNIPSDVILRIAEVILGRDLKFVSNVLWKILYKISTFTDLSNCSALDSISIYLNDIQYVVPYRIRHLVPLACIIARYIKIESYTLQLTNTICQMADAEVMDVDIRYIAAQAVNEFAHIFLNLVDKVKVNLLKAVIMLLQDEDENIRNRSTIFVQILLDIRHTIQPYVCLRKLMEHDFLTLLFPNTHEIISDLFENLRHLLHCYDLKSCKNNIDYNPFSNDVRNIYFETDVLKKYMKQ